VNHSSFCKKNFISKNSDVMFLLVLNLEFLFFLLQAALAAKRARELVRQKSVLKSSSLPGKLADCSSTDPEESGSCSIYIYMYIFLFLFALLI